MSTGTSPHPLKSRLRENLEYLVNELRVSNYLDALFQAEVITRQDTMNLGGQSDRYEQARQLLEIVSGKSEDKIAKFLDIVKTRENMQRHIYLKLFEEDNSLQRDSLKQSTVKNQANGSPKLKGEVKKPSTAEPELDMSFQSVIPHCLDKVLHSLKSSHLADHLRAKQLINREDYSQLTSVSSEEDRGRLLLQDILPKKGPQTYAKFRQVLLTVQKDIVLDILEPAERGLVVQEKEESCIEPPKKKKKKQEIALETVDEENASTVESDEEEDEELCSFLDKPVDSKHIAAVKKWGNERWRQLGRALGFSDPDISDIEGPVEREGNREKLHQIMHRWQQRDGVKATLRVLLEACKEPDVKIYGQVVAEIKAQQKKKGKKRGLHK